MFSTTGLFKNIPCPRPETCQAVHCIFSHDAVLSKGSHVVTEKETVPEGPATKRRRLEEAFATPSSDARGKVERAQKSQLDQGWPQEHVNGRNEAAPSMPESLKRAITPPVSSTSKPTTVSHAKSVQAKQETLNPRAIETPPAGHDKRTLYLKHMHEQMKRLNDMIDGAKGSEHAALRLSEQELIKASLDEEEQLAGATSAVYPNVIKQRIGTYRKMTLDGWATHLKSNIFGSTKIVHKETGLKPIVTDLSPSQEVRVLAELTTNERELDKLGYILKPPTETAIEDAVRMTEESKHHEICDRCKTRFQVFPDRRQEDGALTTNGPCIYHWGKLRRPKGQKTDAQTGRKEPVYTCCGDLEKSTGCVTAESHVYKMNAPPQMATVLQFMNTPENESPASDENGKVPAAITFDCEMGYTALGLELIRLTAVTWPLGSEIMDVLVQPQGTILDLNSRFSGVFPSHFKEGTAWTEGAPLTPKRGAKGEAAGPLPLLASPEEARRILCSFITPLTPLIGHALENDLNSVRLCHPTVIDTVALFPHPRGLPIRFALKQLASTHLERDIQTGGEAGHDSLEDARATGDLVRVKVAQKWKAMQKMGWKKEGEKLVAPTAGK